MVFAIRSLILLGCALLSLNLLGSDPSDIIFAATAALVLLFAPGTLFLNGIAPGARLTLAMIVVLYAISCTFGWRSPSFVLYFVSGLLFTLSVYWSTWADDAFPIGNALFGGFLILSLTTVVLWSLGNWPQSVFFDLFRDGRFMGPPGDPNMTGLTGSFALYFFLDRAVRPSSSRIALMMALLGILVSAAIILTSGSRSAWGATVAGLAIYFLVSRRSFSMRTVTTGLVLMIGVMLVSMGAFGSSGNVEDVSDRFRTLLVQDQSAEQERFGFVYTRAALDVAVEHPFGVGPGMTPMYTGISSVDGDPIGAHNSYAEIIAENGWATAVLLFTLLTLAWRRLYLLADRDVFFNDMSCRMLLAGLTSTAIFGMGHDLLGWRVGWILPVLAILATFSHRYQDCVDPDHLARI